MSENKGDLISREALRKEVTEKVNFTTIDGHIVYDEMLKLIDNASTIDTGDYARGFYDGIKHTESLYERPQGANNG